VPGSNAGNRARAGVNIGSRAFASYSDKMNRNLVQHLSSVENGDTETSDPGGPEEEDSNPSHGGVLWEGAL
jgi:hypothetical protein